MALQTQALESVRRAGNQALASQLERNLERYRRGESCDPGGGG